ITLARIVDMLTERSPASLKVCTCFDKTECRKVDLQADYVGYTCPSEFLVGYGLDFAERYRNLPYVGILDPRIYR
ncbi:MAG: hypoxanthine phosphoribosyltransferase, partial [Clostridiales bacterium]|nr:hypoxanthine phosphoribosyltransferase [Clostridiales bacterium]